jgi:putative oxidoreductase
MRRLLNYTFPNSWMGVGLLILRLAEGSTSIVSGLFQNWRFSDMTVNAAHLLELTTGSLLIVGLWTPIAGPLLALSELGRAIFLGRIDSLGLMRFATGLALAMTGPGAWSLDARFFGRRRIDVQSLQD